MYLIDLNEDQDEGQYEHQDEYLDVFYDLIILSKTEHVPISKIEYIINKIQDICEMIQRRNGLIPIELLLLWDIDPIIVEYLYNKWHSDPSGLIYIYISDIEIPDYIERVSFNTYRIADIIKDILEKLYTLTYYTIGENSHKMKRLDEYARICGVEYEKKRPYGEWPRAVAEGVKDM
jgi:hypothetical protein